MSMIDDDLDLDETPPVRGEPTTITVRVEDAPADDPREIITVWVRLGVNENTKERTLAFWIPKGLNQGELLDDGFTIDGTQAVLTVAQDDDDGRYSVDNLYKTRGGTPYTPYITDTSLMRLLGDTQRMLVMYLSDRGYTVKFK